MSLLSSQAVDNRRAVLRVTTLDSIGRVAESFRQTAANPQKMH